MFGNDAAGSGVLIINIVHICVIKIDTKYNLIASK